MPANSSFDILVKDAELENLLQQGLQAGLIDLKTILATCSNIIAGNVSSDYYKDMWTKRLKTQPARDRGAEPSIPKLDLIVDSVRQAVRDELQLFHKGRKGRSTLVSSADYRDGTLRSVANDDVRLQVPSEGSHQSESNLEASYSAHDSHRVRTETKTSVKISPLDTPPSIVRKSFGEDVARKSFGEDAVFDCGITAPVMSQKSSTGLQRLTYVNGLSEEKMKENVRVSIAPKPYDVVEFYHSRGLWRSIAVSSLFENVTMSIIAVNALWLAIDTDWNKAPTFTLADPVFQIMEHLFCVYFSFEWFVRFMSFANKLDGRRDGWFVFDSILVVMMVCETWLITCYTFAADTGSSGGSPLGNASILRLLRLARLTRMLKMLRSMPELLILVKGMIAAGRSVFCTMLLLFGLVYVYAIVMTSLAAEEPDREFFKSIPHSMYTLILFGTLLDNVGGEGSPLETMISHSLWVHVVIFFTFVTLSGFMVLNMLIGVLCEVVSGVAVDENEQMTVSWLKGKMHEIVAAIDLNGDFSISILEFSKMLENTEAVQLLHEVGVDPISLMDLSDYLFTEDGGGERSLSFDDFMDAVLELRGSNNAKVKDVMHLSKAVRKEFEILVDCIKDTFEEIKCTSIGQAQTGNSRLPDNTRTRQQLPNAS